MQLAHLLEGALVARRDLAVGRVGERDVPRVLGRAAEHELARHVLGHGVADRQQPLDRLGEAPLAQLDLRRQHLRRGEARVFPEQLVRRLQGAVPVARREQGPVGGPDAVLPLGIHLPGIAGQRIDEEGLLLDCEGLRLRPRDLRRRRRTGRRAAGPQHGEERRQGQQGRQPAPGGVRPGGAARRKS